MRASFLALLLGLTACSAQTDLAYRPQPSGAFVPHPLIAAVRVEDHRGVADPRDVGAVMGIGGKPLKPVTTPGPAAESVAQAFRTALAARGDLAPPGLGRYDLDVTILGLRAEQWAERQGQVDLLVRLVDRFTGREAYSARTYVESRGDNFLAVDNFEFGSPAALAGIDDALLTRAIDDTLQRGGFNLALRQ